MTNSKILYIALASVAAFILIATPFIAMRMMNKPRPNMTEYMNCMTTTCYSMMCQVSDTTCIAAANANAGCQINSPNCMKWQTDFGKLLSNSTLPDDYYNCDADCRPTKATSGNFYPIYSCWATCGGV